MKNITENHDKIPNKKMEQENININRVPMHALFVNNIPEGCRIILDVNDLGRPADIIFINSRGMYFSSSHYLYSYNVHYYA